MRAIQDGELGWTRADILECKSSGEGAAIRGVLEQFGVTVGYFPIGQARHLIRLIGGEATAPYLVISCHGDEGGILLPDLAPEWEERQPVHHRFMPGDVLTHASLDHQTVICTGCEMGTDAMGQAWLDRGASAYVAPEGYPDGGAPLIVISRLVYELARNRPLDEAIDQIRRHDSELAMWRMWSR